MVSRQKHIRKGRPKNVVAVDERNPDNHSSLVEFLKATGKLRHTTYTQLLRARYLYYRHVNVDKIAAEVGVEPAVIDRWALCFSWDEERDRRMFNRFRRISGLEKIYGADIGVRHDRIAGSIEQIAERLLQQHANGNNVMSARDLSTLAATIRATQEIRRTARGENADKKESNVNISIGVPGNIDKLAGALMDAFDRPKLLTVESRGIALGAESEIGRDTQYEAAVGSPEASKEPTRKEAGSS